MIANLLTYAAQIAKAPPEHMDIAYGRVRIRTKTKRAEATHRADMDEMRATQRSLDCHICRLRIGAANASVACPVAECAAVFHMVCLASAFLEPGQYVPVQGKCPQCRAQLLWGRLIRQAEGCADLTAGGTAADCADVETWSDVDDEEGDDGSVE